MKAISVALLLLISAFSIKAQNQDSLMQVQYASALKKLEANNLNDAVIQFTQLINSNFSNKEVYVKRGVAYAKQQQYEKAKADLDEAVKARINTAELFE